MVPDVAGQVPQDGKSLEGLYLLHLPHNQHVTIKYTPSIHNYILSLFKLTKNERFFCVCVGGGGVYLFNFLYSSLTLCLFSNVQFLI